MDDDQMERVLHYKMEGATNPQPLKVENIIISAADRGLPPGWFAAAPFGLAGRQDTKAKMRQSFLVSLLCKAPSPPDSHHSR